MQRSSQSPQNRQRRFTVLDSLIVVATLGVLAAVVTPYVGRFLGRGEAEAQKTELHDVQAAVIAMMTDNGVRSLTSVDTDISNGGLRNLANFPDTTGLAVPTGTKGAGDKLGYTLFGHDKLADGAQTGLINYVSAQCTAWEYAITSVGSISQSATKSTAACP